MGQRESVNIDIEKLKLLQVGLGKKGGGIKKYKLAVTK